MSILTICKLGIKVCEKACENREIAEASPNIMSNLFSSNDFEVL